MNLICCIDANNGMMFNKRRQSRDRILNEYIIKKVKENKLWVNEYSSELFKNYQNVLIDNELIKKAEKNDYVFIEDIDPMIIENKVDTIILYNWNRNYPADMYFDINLTNWIKVSENELAGSSHEKISEIIYKRGNK